MRNYTLKKPSKLKKIGMAALAGLVFYGGYKACHRETVEDIKDKVAVQETVKKEMEKNPEYKAEIAYEALKFVVQQPAEMQKLEKILADDYKSNTGIAKTTAEVLRIAELHSFAELGTPEGYFSPKEGYCRAEMMPGTEQKVIMTIMDTKNNRSYAVERKEFWDQEILSLGSYKKPNIPENKTEIKAEAKPEASLKGEEKTPMNKESLMDRVVQKSADTYSDLKNFAR